MYKSSVFFLWILTIFGLKFSGNTPTYLWMRRFNLNLAVIGIMWLLILNTLIFPVVLMAQTGDDLDSLILVHKRSLVIKDTAEVIKTSKYIGDNLSDNGNYELSDKYFKVGLEWATAAGNDLEIGKLFNLLASNASEIGRCPEALAYYDLSYAAFKKINDLNRMAMVLMNIGTEYSSQGNFSKAIDYEMKAVRYKEQSGNTDNLAYYYQKIGELFKNVNFIKWKYYADKAYKVMHFTEANIVTKASIFNDLGGIAEKTKNYSQAYIWYDSLYNLSKKANYQQGVALSLSNRSIILHNENRFSEALKMRKEALEISKKLGNKYHILSDNIHVASTLIEMGQYREANDYAIESLHLAQTLKFYPNEEAEAYKILALIGEKTKNWKSAYEYFIKYTGLQETLLSDKVQDKLNQLETMYQISEKGKKIAQLDNENLLKDKRLVRIWVIVAFIVLVFISIVYLNRKKRLESQKTQAELKQKLLRSQMNPHFIFNTLNAINHFIMTKQGVEASDYLSRYSMLIRQILENSAEEFVSVESEKEFINNYLILQQLRFNNLFTYSIDIDEAIEQEFVMIPPMIVQPFIENSIEHGFRGMNGNGILKISFHMRGNMILAIVSDNGCGMKGCETDEYNDGSDLTEKSYKKHRSFAVEITRERLAVCGLKGEHITIESPLPGEEKGTIVTVLIPVKQ